MTILIDRTVSNLSDITGNSSKFGFPPLFSNSIIGVKPMTQPTGIYYALRYIYSGTNNQTPTFTNFSPSMLYPSIMKPFNLNGEDSPMFMSVIPEIINLDEGKDLDRRKLMQKLLKIIIQIYLYHLVHMMGH